MSEMGGEFWPIEQLRAAKSAREIAGQLLRLPDGIVFYAGARLQAECVRRQFAAGAHFLAWREAALNAIRDAHGLLPTSQALELEAWRLTMSAFAAGQRDDLPEFMMGENSGVANQG